MIGILALCFFVSAAFAGNLDYAKSLYEQEKYDQALPEFQDVFQTSQGDDQLDAMLHMLRCYQFTRDYGSLVSFYNENREMADNSMFEPEIDYVFANYLKDHVKDYTAARDLYESIYQNFPNAGFAGPGSLLKLGDIDVIEEKPNNALSSYNELIANYHQCPYVDNALLGKVNAYAKLKNRENILKTLSEIKLRFPQNLCLAKAQLKAGMYFASIERNRKQAIKQFGEVVNQFPNTRAGIMAKIRLADLAPSHDIAKSIDLYNQVIEDWENLNNYQKAWVECELGFAYLLKGDKQAARDRLENVANSPIYSPKYKEKASLYVQSLNDPQSMESYETAFDLAFRHREYLDEFDRADKHYRNISELARIGVLEEKINDPEIPDHAKAKWLYQLSIAQYFLTEFKDARETAEKILLEYPGQEETRVHAEFLIAFLDSFSAKHELAINQYLDILETFPNVSFGARIMREIALSQVQLGLKDEALITLDGIVWLYPFHMEAQNAQKGIDFLLKGDAALQKSYQSLTLTKSSNQLNTLLAGLEQNSSFRAKFYNVLQSIKIAQSQKPVIDLDFEKILVSMK